jgi:hypothetical protein
MSHRLSVTMQMICLFFILALLEMLAQPLPRAIAQSSPAPTLPIPKLITTGGTFQTLLTAGSNPRSLSIQNNMTTADNCWILIGGPWQAGDTTASSRNVNGQTLTAAQGAIILNPGGSYSRYSPLVPSDQVLVTCTTTGDSIYADIQ